MPDVNESNLFVLERASDLNTISSPTDADVEGVGDDEDERSDDIPSELLIPDAIPEIDEHSTDEDDELVPLSQSKSSVQTTAHEYEQNRPVDVNQTTVAKAMDFRRGHFKRDSSLSTTSSSSEESLSKGLQFPDHTSVDGGGSSTLRQLTAAPGNDGASSSSQLLALAVKTQAQTLLPSLMSTLVQWGANNEVVSTDNQPLANRQRRQVTALDSSDESDFEILETDDFK